MMLVTRNEDDLQAVVIISAAQVICMSVSASGKVSQSEGCSGPAISELCQS